MSIEKHLEARNVTLTEDNSLPAGQRSQKVVKRLIAAVRAAESEFNDELRDANERCRNAQAQVIELQERVRLLESELRRHKVEQKLQQIEKLTVADRQQLLEVS